MYRVSIGKMQITIFFYWSGKNKMYGFSKIPLGFDEFR